MLLSEGQCGILEGPSAILKGCSAPRALKDLMAWKNGRLDAFAQHILLQQSFLGDSDESIAVWAAPNGHFAWRLTYQFDGYGAGNNGGCYDVSRASSRDRGDRQSYPAH